MHDKQTVQGHLIVECTWCIFGTQIEDQDQAQDEDKVWVLVTIGNHLVERNGLKQIERKELKEGIEVTHQVKSITWINQSSYFKWVSRMVLGERSLLPSVGTCRLCVGKPSVVLGRLIWKWWSEGHLRSLVEANQKGWSRKASNTQKKASHDISSGIPNSSLI